MIKGIKFSCVESGIKAKGLDLGLVLFEEEMNCFSAYTRNRVKAAHIHYNMKQSMDRVKALLVNSGCANACTGMDGIKDLRDISHVLSNELGIEKNQVLFSSTGVIGKRLPKEIIKRAIPKLINNLHEENIEGFARAIMTTDTYPKIVKFNFKGKKEYTIIGVAKGAGMINPLFATMLVFLFTDYPAIPKDLSRYFKRSVKETFERISVDGECSTNDTVLFFTKKGQKDETGLNAFKESVFRAMKELSLMVVKDGEGATKIIHIFVKGAKNKAVAEKIARRIAISPLSKTAFFGCDPNWGRFIAAAGDAGVPFNPDRTEIILEGRTLVKNGVEVPFDEADLKKLMDNKEIELTLHLHEGNASFDMYTTDLTYDYIKVNASYRS
ncbi:MAG: bifunctional glutamate N-acetyltransferase/amino-acid acetyltransferase ArgJ [Syntrophorhabdaceae bacterium]|nr:bifunctional glutamate N-acetyltransferase/amino-acid acetyltransferase ArgJ [Syntrophorhabdaceae bacterium]